MRKSFKFHMVTLFFITQYNYLFKKNVKSKINSSICINNNCCNHFKKRLEIQLVSIAFITFINYLNILYIIPLRYNYLKIDYLLYYKYYYHLKMKNSILAAKSYINIYKKL